MDRLQPLLTQQPTIRAHVTPVHIRIWYLPALCNAVGAGLTPQSIVAQQGSVLAQEQLWEAEWSKQGLLSGLSVAVGPVAWRACF